MLGVLSVLRIESFIPDISGSGELCGGDDSTLALDERLTSFAASCSSVTDMLTLRISDRSFSDSVLMVRLNGDMVELWWNVLAGMRRAAVET